MNLAKRHYLREKEAKEIFVKASKNLRKIDVQIFIKNLEVIRIDPQNEVFLSKGKPSFINIGNEVFPTLLNNDVLTDLPKITVDKGAVLHVCNGANLMAPGIMKVIGEFQTGEMAIVVDVEFLKPLALVKTLFNSKEMAEKRQGKVAENIHYVGDKFWEAFKNMKKKG